MAVGPDTPITQLAGVGETRAKKLTKLGLAQAADLLTYYPRDYEDRRRYMLCGRPLWDSGYVWPPWRPSTRGRPASARGWSWSS